MLRLLLAFLLATPCWGGLIYVENNATNLTDTWNVPCDFAFTAGTVNRGMLASGAAGATEVTVTVPALAVNEIMVVFQAVPAGITWSAGTWTVRLNVTAANSNITLDQVWLFRYDSASCTFQQDMGQTNGQAISLSTTGVKTVSVTGSAGTPSANDAIVILCMFSNISASAADFGFTPSVNIDSPFTIIKQTIVGQAAKQPNLFLRGRNP